MKALASVLLLSVTLGLVPALAQTAPTAPVPAASAPAATAATAPDTTKDGKPRMKVVRAQCRDEIVGQDLKGDARKQAMAACIVKARPDMEARVKCRMDPQAKGLDKDARRTFVKDCVAKAKG